MSTDDRAWDWDEPVTLIEVTDFQCVCQDWNEIARGAEQATTDITNALSHTRGSPSPHSSPSAYFFPTRAATPRSQLTSRTKPSRQSTP